MVIGDYNLHTQTIGFIDSFNTGDAIIYGDQQLRLALGSQINNFRGQAIAIIKTIGH